MANRTRCIRRKNFLPTAADQMNFGTRALNIIGQWSSSSKMPERYDRSVRAKELLIRNAITSKFNEGWAIAPSFHLPMSVDSSQRVRKAIETNELADAQLDTQIEVATAEVTPVIDARKLPHRSLTPRQFPHLRRMKSQKMIPEI